VVGCDFHKDWPSSNCCLGPRRRNDNNNLARFHSRNSKLPTRSSYHEIEIPLGSPTHVVITEVNSVPVHTENGILSKFVEKMNRGTKFEHPRFEDTRASKGVNGEEGDVPVPMGDPNEIVVSYDVWRTVEEKLENN